MATSYLSRSTGTTNKTTFTVSVWAKRTNNGQRQVIWSSDKQTNDTGDGTKGGSGIGLQFWNDDQFYLGGFGGNFQIRSNGLQRDNSGWYHIVAQIDTTQADQNNRAKLWINGENVSSLSAMVGQNTDVKFATNRIGVKSETANYSDPDNLLSYYDGCLTHLHVCDGQTYEASDFGFTDSTTGVWMPKVSPSVTYGSDGYFLKFENSGSLGTDSSGNGNNFSVGGGTPTQTLDTPTNNFCTVNPLTNLGSGSLTMGALRVESGNDMQGTFGVTKGRWYWECTRSNSNQTFHCGITSSFSHYSSDQFVGGSSLVGTILIRDNPANDQFTQNGGGISSISTVTDNNTGVSQGAIVGHYLDLESSQKSFTIYVNNSLAQKYNFNYDGKTPVYPAIRMNTGCIGAWNFGNGYFGTTAVSSSNADANGLGLFEYSPTLSGVNYYALCSENLASLG